VRIQRSGNESRSAGMTLDLAAGRLGKASGPEQYHRVRLHVVALRHRSSNGTDDGFVAVPV
jgi:hypothetical protein